MTKVVCALLATLACTSASVVRTSDNAPSFELLILHNNDMHARFEQTSQLSGACTLADRDAGKCYGGFPRVAYVVKEARKAASSGSGPPVLYLNAGDTYTGTAWFTIYKWKIAAEFINALQPDAVSLGNDEFNADTHKQSPLVEAIEPTILACNIIANSEIGRKLKKSVIFDVEGHKVGAIGYLKLDHGALDTTADIEYVDEFIAVKEEVKKLKAQGVNIIIALGHSDDAKDLEIAKEIDGIDLVISGHKNSFFWNGTSAEAEIPDSFHAVVVTQTSGKQVLIVHSYAYSKYLGRLAVTFNAVGEIIQYDDKPVFLDATIPQNTEILNIIKTNTQEIAVNSDTVVGTTSVFLDGDSCTIAECNLGNLVTDAIMYVYATNFEGETWTDASVAIIPAGNIAASIAPLSRPAEVTRDDLLTALPMESSLVAVTMSGTELIQLIEHSVADLNPSGQNPQFLQYSGIRVIYDIEKPSGSRIVNALVRCWSCVVPEFYIIEASRSYKVLMPVSLADGAYGYTMLQGLSKEAVSFDEVTSVSQFIQLRSPVYPEVSGRITLLNFEPDPNAGSKPALTTTTIFIVSLVMLLNM